MGSHDYSASVPKARQIELSREYNYKMELQLKKSYHDQEKITLLLHVFNIESVTMFHCYVFNYACTLSLLTTATTALFACVSSRCTVKNG